MNIVDIIISMSIVLGWDIHFGSVGCVGVWFARGQSNVLNFSVSSESWNLKSRGDQFLFEIEQFLIVTNIIVMDDHQIVCKEFMRDNWLKRTSYPLPIFLVRSVFRSEAINSALWLAFHQRNHPCNPRLCRGWKTLNTTLPWRMKPLLFLPLNIVCRQPVPPTRHLLTSPATAALFITSIINIIVAFSQRCNIGTGKHVAGPYFFAIIGLFVAGSKVRRCLFIMPARVDIILGVGRGFPLRC